MQNHSHEDQPGMATVGCEGAESNKVPEPDAIIEAARLFVTSIKPELIDLDSETHDLLGPANSVGLINPGLLYIQSDRLRDYIDQQSSRERIIKDWIAAGVLVPGDMARS